MHPTPDEQLRAVARLLEQVSADPGLAPGSRATLDDAGRLLRRLERSWPRRLPFLVDDNRRATDLLVALGALMPALAAEIDTVAALPPTHDEPAAHDRNKQLQGLLGRAVHLLPDSPEGHAGRARIAAHLRARLAADPALNRTPAERPPN